MIINYKENPLLTTVELSDLDKRLLQLQLKLERYEDFMFTAHLYLREGDPLFKFDVERARAELDPKRWCSDETTKVDEWVAEGVEHHVEALLGPHGGDCVCQPMTCPKCHAEQLLGIDTLAPYPGKHALHQIEAAFSYRDGEVWKERSYSEAVAKLENYDPQPTQAWKDRDPTGELWAKWLPQWRQQAAAALAYLRAYHAAHFE
jgi:hypothetical protein